MNISELIHQNAKEFPTKRAVVFPKSFGIYEYYSFEIFEKKVNQYAHFLSKQGINLGDSVLVFVKPSLDFSVLIFALFRMGAVPVLMDPGMGLKNLLNSIKQCRPKYLIAETAVHLVKLFQSKVFASIQKSFFVNHLKTKIKNESQDYYQSETKPADVAAILFTSGGTGAPKGVVYTHQIFMQQTFSLKKMFGLTPLDIDLPGFPLFSLFTIALGMTSCIPDMNPSKPAKVNPKNIVKNIIDNNVTFAAGSPAIWERVADYCLRHHIVLEKCKYIVMFGAPVRRELIQKLKEVLSIGDVYTPYGATECLPISNISGDELCSLPLNVTKGTCVGIPIEGTKVRVIKTQLSAIEKIEDVTDCPVGEIGEIIVQSPSVTPEYFELPEQTALAKIKDESGLWHRMGDMGAIDSDGRVWFCGRKSHIVELEDKSLYSIPLESVFNQHPEIKRTALVGLVKSNKVQPTLIIEPKKSKFLLGKKAKQKIISELKEMGKISSDSALINEFYFERNFPVDGRHNIKIDRLKLRDHYQKRLR